MVMGLNRDEGGDFQLAEISTLKLTIQVKSRAGKDKVQQVREQVPDSSFNGTEIGWQMWHGNFIVKKMMRTCVGHDLER